MTSAFNSFILSLILDRYFFSIALCAVRFSCFGFFSVCMSIFSNKLNCATENVDEDVDEEDDGDCGKLTGDVNKFVKLLLCSRIGGDFEFSGD